MIATGIPWFQPSKADLAIREWVERAAHTDRPWAALWCAGAGIVGTDEALLAEERLRLACFLASVSVVSERGCGPTSVFVASSAGGVYGESSDLWRTENSIALPISSYGKSKLQQDQTSYDWSILTGIPTLIGRISNLYGPQQNLSKPQGFISHVCKSVLRREPLRLSVSADTQRDFVHVDDVALRIAKWISNTDRPPGPTIKILCAGTSTSLRTTIQLVTRISRSPVRIAVRPGPAGQQPQLLRFRSVVDVHIDRYHPARSLDQGIAEIWNASVLDFARGASAGHRPR
jgi:UDP-glucose 4-epimerase